MRIRLPYQTKGVTSNHVIESTLTSWAHADPESEDEPELSWPAVTSPSVSVLATRRADGEDYGEGFRKGLAEWISRQ